MQLISVLFMLNSKFRDIYKRPDLKINNFYTFLALNFKNNTIVLIISCCKD